jgi:hypothetical protein
MPTEQEDIQSIGQTWEGAANIQEIVQRRGMNWFQKQLTFLYNANHTYYLTQVLAGVMSVQVHTRETLLAVVNERTADPIDRKEIISDVLDALQTEDDARLSLLIPILIANEAKLNAMPEVQPEQ